MIPQEIIDSITGFFTGLTSVKFQIHSADALSGGCINHVCRITTSAGRYCLKYNNDNDFPGMFDSEAKGLSTLNDANEIRIPGVIHSGTANRYSYILLEFITAAPAIPGFMEDFGRSLARLHRHSADFFGNDNDNYMGALPQSNRKHKDWVSFFIEERLEKQVSIADQAGFLSSGIRDSFQRMYDRLDEIFPKEKPSLLHGDLWGGNYIVSEKGKACLIDPAVYYGHREIDIAMTTLFGGFGASFYSAYNDEFPLEKEWRSRLGICNLYPLLIHLNLFGSGYLGQIESIVKKF
jgi:protein-ribulosamine 3-kinase